MDGLSDKFATLLTKWAALAGLGSFVLYVLGYLTLRFKLSAYGVATNLDIWDEQYLFAGSRFIVYLVSSVPNVLLIVTVLVGIAYLPYRLIPCGIREGIKQRFLAWSARPGRLEILGIAVALGLIQILMRKCFVFGNMLLANKLSGQYQWLEAILLSPDTSEWYFTCLVGGTLLTGAVFIFAARDASALTSASRVAFGVLGFLLAVEFLLLPVNYGILIDSRLLPRVSDLGGHGDLATGQSAWLVWQSKEDLIYLVRGADGQRSMITIPRKDQKLRILRYDDIFALLFERGHGDGPVVPE